MNSITPNLRPSAWASDRAASVFPVSRDVLDEHMPAREDRCEDQLELVALAHDGRADPLEHFVTDVADFADGELRQHHRC